MKTTIAIALGAAIISFGACALAAGHTVDGFAYSGTLACAPKEESVCITKQNGASECYCRPSWPDSACEITIMYVARDPSKAAADVRGTNCDYADIDLAISVALARRLGLSAFEK